MKNLFNISVYLVFIVALLSSCQIEKRHFSKGYFIALSRNNMFHNNQAFLPKEEAISVDSFAIAQVNLIQVESIECDSLDSNNSFKTERNTFTKSKNCKTGSVIQYCHQTAPNRLKIGAHWYSSANQAFSKDGINKFHPLAIFGIGFLVLSISSFLIFSYFLWASSFFVVLFFLFLIMSIVTMYIARKKVMLSPDKWAGKKIVNIIFFIEVGFMLLILLGMLLILPIIL